MTEIPSGNRIEAQYLQSAMQLWTNINVGIWTALGLILAIQSGAIAASYVTRQSLASIAIIVSGAAIATALLAHIKSNMYWRGVLLAQCNYIAAELMPPFFAGRPIPVSLQVPFKLYDTGLDTKVHHARYKFGFLLCLLGIYGIDIVVCILVNLPPDIASLRVLGRLPLLNVNGCN